MAGIPLRIYWRYFHRKKKSNNIQYVQLRIYTSSKTSKIHSMNIVHIQIIQLYIHTSYLHLLTVKLTFR